MMMMGMTHKKAFSSFLFFFISPEAKTKARGLKLQPEAREAGLSYSKAIG